MSSNEILREFLLETHENLALLDADLLTLEKNPTDELAKLYIQRCQDYIAEPPDDSWDGVFVMKTK